MTLQDRITQARHDRSARAAARAASDKLADELSSYTSEADRLEIELIAARTPGPGADLLLHTLDRIRTRELTVAGIRKI